MRLLPSPYPELEAVDYWGETRLTVESDEGRVLLLNWIWDLNHLGDWYTENVEALCQGELEIVGERPRSDESLAEAIDRLRDRDFDEDDEDAMFQYDGEIYEYRKAHGLWAAFRGTRIPDIIVGCNRGDGEISLSEISSQVAFEDYEERPLSDCADVKLGAWSFRFDMQAFLTELQNGLQITLTEWLAGDRAPHSRKAFGELLQNLPNVPCCDCCGEPA